MTACTTRMERLSVPTHPAWFDQMPARRALWHETPEERRQRLMRAACAAHLLAWVRDQLDDLTEPQHHAIVLHYFFGLSLREAGRLLQRDAGTVLRAEKRALRLLRARYRATPALEPYVRLYRLGLRGLPQTAPSETGR